MSAIVIAGKKYNESNIIDEKEEFIRLEAVDLFFGLKTLVNDISWLVRVAVARKKVGHEVFVNDSDWRVRASVAQYTDDLNLLAILENDESDYVRFIIVKRGYNLDLFVNDKDEEIASLARYQKQIKNAA